MSGCFCTNLAVLAKNPHLDPLFLPSAPLLYHWPVPLTAVRPPVQNGLTTLLSSKRKRRKKLNWGNTAGGYRGLEIHKALGLNLIHRGAFLCSGVALCVSLSDFHPISLCILESADWLTIGITKRTICSLCLVRGRDCFP